MCSKIILFFIKCCMNSIICLRYRIMNRRKWSGLKMHPSSGLIPSFLTKHMLSCTVSSMLILQIQIVKRVKRKIFLKPSSLWNHLKMFIKECHWHRGRSFSISVPHTTSFKSWLRSSVHYLVMPCLLCVRYGLEALVMFSFRTSPARKCQISSVVKRLREMTEEKTVFGKLLTFLCPKEC